MSKYSFIGIGSLIGPRATGAWRFLGPAALVLGIIADLMQPLAPFPRFLFMVSALAAVLLLIVIFAKEAINIPLIWGCIFAVVTAIVSGGITLFQTSSPGTSGVIAEIVPALKQFQISVGLIREDLADIKETGQRTAEGVEKIAESTKEIALSLTDISRSFEALSQSGGVIKNPMRPEQFYHNARIHEQGGDYGNARRSYSRYFTFKLEFLDPHLRYQTFLKIQEGRVGALEIILQFMRKIHVQSLNLLASCSLPHLRERQCWRVSLPRILNLHQHIMS